EEAALVVRRRPAVAREVGRDHAVAAPSEEGDRAEPVVRRDRQSVEEDDRPRRVARAGRVEVEGVAVVVEEAVLDALAAQQLAGARVQEGEGPGAFPGGPLGHESTMWRLSSKALRDGPRS